MKSVMKAAVSAVAAIVMSTAAFGGTVNFNTSNSVSAGVAYNQLYFAANPANMNGVQGYPNGATLWTKATAFSFSGNVIPTDDTTSSATAQSVVLSSEGLGVRSTGEGTSNQDDVRINNFRTNGSSGGVFNEAVKLEFFTGAYDAAAVAAAPTATTPGNLTSYGAAITSLTLNKWDSSDTAVLTGINVVVKALVGQAPKTTTLTIAPGSSVTTNGDLATLDLIRIFNVQEGDNFSLLSLTIGTLDNNDQFTLAGISAEFGTSPGSVPTAVPLPTAVWGGLALMGTIAARRRMFA